MGLELPLTARWPKFRLTPFLFCVAPPGFGRRAKCIAGRSIDPPFYQCVARGAKGTKRFFAGLLAAPAGFCTDPVVLVLRGVLFAFIGAKAAGHSV